MAKESEFPLGPPVAFSHQRLVAQARRGKDLFTQHTIHLWRFQKGTDSSWIHWYTLDQEFTINLPSADTVKADAVKDH